jgi:hypothetical protein
MSGTENGSPNIINNINGFNDNASYYELFNQDIWITIIVFIIVFFIAAYFFIKSTIRSYKAEWENNKCNPVFMPFASIINPDLANGDDFAYVLDNFKDCLDMLNAETATKMTKPINNIRENLGTYYSNLYGVAYTTYEYVVNLFNLMLHFARLFLEKILNFTLHTQLVFITINDFFAKILSVFTVIFYTLQLLIGAYRLIFTLAVMGFLIAFVIPASVILTIQTIILITGIVRLVVASFGLPFTIGWFLLDLVVVIIGIVTFIFALIFLIIITLFYTLLLSFVSEIEIN